MGMLGYERVQRTSSADTSTSRTGTDRPVMRVQFPWRQLEGRPTLRGGAHKPRIIVCTLIVLFLLGVVPATACG